MFLCGFELFLWKLLTLDASRLDFPELREITRTRVIGLSGVMGHF
jgi:hypothetical protein